MYESEPGGTCAFRLQNFSKLDMLIHMHLRVVSLSAGMLSFQESYMLGHASFYGPLSVTCSSLCSAAQSCSSLPDIVSSVQGKIPFLQEFRRLVDNCGLVRGRMAVHSVDPRLKTRLEM